MSDRMTTPGYELLAGIIEKRDAEIKRLRAEGENLLAHNRRCEEENERLQREETEYMKRCSEQHEWEENERVRLQAENERLRAALAPFAVYADPTNQVPDDFHITNGSHLARKQLRMGDCYAARRALEGKE